jgi:hypothetical protein
MYADVDVRSCHMIAAISPQWIAVAAASAVVVILLVVLLVRRSREEHGAGSSTGELPAAARSGSTFLDEPVRGGFEGLGKAVYPSGVAPPSDQALAEFPPAPAPADNDANLDIAPRTAMPAADVEPAVPAPEPSEPAPEEAPEAPVAVPPPEAGPTPSAAEATSEPGTSPLSDIIVTTNRQEVDLTDPETRALLEELVSDEIALAEVYKQQGQTLDAILQLTEAEKACAALGMDDQAERIRTMMTELQA